MAESVSEKIERPEGVKSFMSGRVYHMGSETIGGGQMIGYIERLEARIAKMTEALRTIADNDNWYDHIEWTGAVDATYIAHEALKSPATTKEDKGGQVSKTDEIWKEWHGMKNEVSNDSKNLGRYKTLAKYVEPLEKQIATMKAALEKVNNIIGTEPTRSDALWATSEIKKALLAVQEPAEIGKEEG